MCIYLKKLNICGLVLFFYKRKKLYALILLFYSCLFQCMSSLNVLLFFNLRTDYRNVTGVSLKLDYTRDFSPSALMKLCVLENTLFYMLYCNEFANMQYTV